MSAVLFAIVAFLGCAPPDPIDPEELLGPTIDVVFPERGQIVELNEDCELDTLIVVDVDGFDLVDFDTAEGPVEGEGHWHGGPDLAEGYCRSFSAFCDDYLSDPLSDGSTASIFVTLVSSDHVPFGDVVQVELELAAPAGVSCP